MNKLGVKAFSLVETLVAAAVIGLAVFSVVVVVRKGQEQMAVDKHRRAARAFVNNTLEDTLYSTGKFSSIAINSTSGIFTIDTDVTTHSHLQASDTIIISSQTDTVVGVPYIKIYAKVQWVEPVGGRVDSVALERWIPNIPSPINIAPMASNITSSTPFAMCNYMGRPPLNCSPEWYYCYPWSIVDGIIGGRIQGDWADWCTGNAWIDINWATTHKVYKIAFYNRTNPAGCWSDGANITLYKGGASVGNTSLSGFTCGSCNSVVFAPRYIDRIFIQPTTISGRQYVGFSEIEVWE